MDSVDLLVSDSEEGGDFLLELRGQLKQLSMTRKSRRRAAAEAAQAMDEVRIATENKTECQFSERTNIY
jgi:hypothetical protein